MHRKNLTIFIDAMPRRNTQKLKKFKVYKIQWLLMRETDLAINGWIVSEKILKQITFVDELSYSFMATPIQET